LENNKSNELFVNWDAKKCSLATLLSYGYCFDPSKRTVAFE